MRLPGKLGDRRGRLRLPGRSVRLRLTALYGGLFLICGVALLAVNYVLVRRATASSVNAPFAADGVGRVPSFSQLGGLLARVQVHQHGVDLHQLLVQSGIALALMVLVSVALGWVVAGRVLLPLRMITARTREITEASLHERLALDGPADELRELADTIDGLLARLEAAFEAQRQFVANASHELRTPLAIMRTRLDVAIAKPEGVPAQTQALDAGLRKDLDRADRLLESFLALARAQSGTLTDRSEVSLDRIVLDALAAQRDRIVELRLDVQTALAPALVAGSETLLARMVENVIENAVRHNQPRGFITAACEQRGGAARLVVESGGPLLDERVVAQLAQPFRRLGVERTGSRNGHGLGLSIVAAIAAAHGGTLELHARPQGGLRVEIDVPSATPAVASVPA